MRRVTLSVGLLVAAAAAGPRTPIEAQDVGVRAYLTPGSTIGVGSPFVLNVEVTGVQSLAQEPELPDLGGFAQFLGSSSQTSMRMVNGRTSVSVTLQYRFQALHEGTYQIPSFEVGASGRLHRTEPLDILVTAASPSQGGSGAAPGGGSSPVESDQLFVTAEATRTRVRDGEPLVVEYRLWTLVDVSSYSFTRVPEPEGFWVEDVTPPGQPQVEQITRDGMRYTTAVIRRVALVPSGPGERTLEPIGLEAQVRVRRADPFSDFFGPSPLFGSSVVPTAILSNAVTITVEPLPPGRPEPFSGVVGALSLTAELDRDSVSANDAVTLRVTARGEGNVRAVPAPELGLPSDFEVFPPEVSESVQPFGPGLSGEKTFEYILIPRAPGARELPAITMGYLDAASGAYRSATTRPIPLTVSGTVVEGPALLSRGGVAQLREDIRFIHLGTASLRPGGQVLFGRPEFWMLALLPLAGIAGATAVRRHRDMLEGDVAYARSRRAGRVARKRLARARSLSGAEEGKAFYAEVARALRGLVADRLNVAEAGLQASQLGLRLREHGVGEATVEELHACLEQCDRQRFAPPGEDPEERTRFLDRVGHLMTSLDRAVRQ